MKRADEPLQEELDGLAVLGVVVGLFAGRLLGLGALFGALLGWQFAPLLVTIKGPNGDRCRAAGWEAHARWQAAKAKARSLWRKADTRFQLKGQWVRFDAPGRWRRFNARFDVTGKGRKAWRGLVGAAERSGVSSRLRRLRWQVALGLERLAAKLR